MLETTTESAQEAISDLEQEEISAGQEEEWWQRWRLIMNGEKGVDFYEAAAQLSKKIEEKYPDCQNYIMFHVAAGSTIDENITPRNEMKFDFPGELSVRKLIENYE